MSALTDFPILEASDDSLLESLFEDPALAAERLHFKRGEEIFAPDTPAKHLFFIASGQVRFHQQGPADATRLIGVLGPKRWFGIAVLARQPVYGSRAVAFTASTVWKAGIEQLAVAFAARPELLAAINLDVARCLIKTREQTTQFIFEDCNQRLISALIRLADTAASTPRDDGVVLHMTHSQLAEAVGAARETVSLGLTQLRNRNLLRTGRSQLFFKPDDLRRTRL